jgi:hypothetical protein
MNDPLQTPETIPGSALYLAGLGLLLAAVLSVVPLVLERDPVGFVAPDSRLVSAGAKAAVVLALGLVLVLCIGADRRREPRPVLLNLVLAGLAGAMTAWHWYAVDVVYNDPASFWYQPGHYLDVLSHRGDAPHPYRPLPYGFIRSLERLTGDFTFARLAYRWLFTFWFLWASHRFARLFHSAGRALVVPAVLVLLYPLSLYHYAGQPTDPISHALFVLALLYTVQDRWVLLAVSLFLGVLAKETVVLMVLGYGGCYWRQGWPALVRTAGLGMVCMAAFLAVRLPLGWQPGNESTNGLPGLMIGTNLGFGEPVAYTSAPLSMNYLQPLLFVGSFVPFIVWNWRRLDGRLKVMFLTLTPLLLFANLCFGWMYEARNYMPLVPLLATLALPPSGLARRAAP